MAGWGSACYGWARHGRYGKAGLGVARYGQARSGTVGAWKAARQRYYPLTGCLIQVVTVRRPQA